MTRWLSLIAVLVGLLIIGHVASAAITKVTLTVEGMT